MILISVTRDQQLPVDWQQQTVHCDKCHDLGIWGFSKGDKNKYNLYVEIFPTRYFCVLTLYAWKYSQKSNIQLEGGVIKSR